MLLSRAEAKGKGFGPCRIAGLLAVLAVAGGGAPGCAPPIAITAGLTVAQAGTSMFVNGQLVSARQAPMEQVWLATLEALDELGFDMRERRPPDSPESFASAFVMAYDDGAPVVRVRLEYVTEKVTRIRVRVGFIGDQSLARLVLARVDARLPPPPEVLRFDERGLTPPSYP